MIPGLWFGRGCLLQDGGGLSSCTLQPGRHLLQRRKTNSLFSKKVCDVVHHHVSFHKDFLEMQHANLVTCVCVQMSAVRRPSFSDIVVELEAMSNEDEEKPAALGKALSS